MSSVTVNVLNKSGRQVDAVTIYHSPTPPTEGVPLSAYPQVINATNLAKNDTSTNSADTTSGDPVDYWLGGVRFEGDGQTYVISGVTFSPYKEYAVSDGATLTITIPQYEENSTNQGDLTFDDGSDPGSAPLLNSTLSEFIEWAELIGEIVAELAE